MLSSNRRTKPTGRNSRATQKRKSNMPRSHATSERYCRCRVYLFSTAKTETTKTHENTRRKTTKFVMLLRIVSCVFVVSSFFIVHELTL